MHRCGVPLAMACPTAAAAALGAVQRRRRDVGSIVQHGWHRRFTSVSGSPWLPAHYPVCFVVPCWVFVLSAAGGAAGRLWPTLQPVTQVEGVSEYRLANGFAVLLLPDQSRPTTTVNLTYLVGSRRSTAKPAWRICGTCCSGGTPKNPGISTRDSPDAA